MFLKSYSSMCSSVLVARRPASGYQYLIIHDFYIFSFPSPFPPPPQNKIYLIYHLSTVLYLNS